MSLANPSESIVSLLARRVRASLLEQFPPEAELDAWVRVCSSQGDIRRWCAGEIDGVIIGEATSNGEPITTDVYRAVQERSPEQTVILQARVRDIKMWMMFWGRDGFSTEDEFECVYKDALPPVDHRTPGAVEERVRCWLSAVITLAESSHARSVEVPAITQPGSLVVWTGPQE